MPADIQFRVIGEPAPQGSKRHVGRGILVESSKKVKPWRQDVAAAALAARDGCEPMSHPVCVSLRFFLARPKSAPKSRRHPDRKPDLDKLIRSTFDAIVTAGLIRDDAQVVDIFASKEFAYSEPLGALIRVWEIPQ